MGHWMRAEGKRCGLCVIPRGSGETYIHCRHRHLPEEPALLLHRNNFSHPGMHRTLSKQYLHCCNHTYVSCMGITTAKKISQASANHMLQGVSLGRVVGKRVLYPSYRDHRNANGSIPDVSGCKPFRQTAT